MMTDEQREALVSAAEEVCLLVEMEPDGQEQRSAIENFVRILTHDSASYGS
ncbi:MAG: hypothetical protein WAK55_09870 [Xanthobacteraceae bacterium]